jgi:hypothetical protein
MTGRLARRLAASSVTALLLLAPARDAAAADVQDWIGPWGASPPPGPTISSRPIASSSSAPMRGACASSAPR